MSGSWKNRIWEVGERIQKRRQYSWSTPLLKVSKSVADLGEGPGGVKKGEITEGRKAGKASKTNRKLMIFKESY